MITEFFVFPGETRKRLDSFLACHERGVSRTRLQRLIHAGRIRVNSYVAKPSQKIKPGDWITIDKPEAGPMLVENQPIALEILYEDPALLVVNKPAGVVMHPSSGNWTGTLLNGVLEHLQQSERSHAPNSRKIYPGLAHRLDKETSGVMVIAKTEQAHRVLCAQFETHAIDRTYEALVFGRLTRAQGVIEEPIGRDVLDRRIVSTHSFKLQTAITEYQVLQSFGAVASLVQLRPHTGRQHQLRVHLASKGCPIMGDPIYGFHKVGLRPELINSRMMLHARKLGFCHPVFNVYKEYTSELPAEFLIFIRGLQKTSGGQDSIEGEIQ